MSTGLPLTLATADALLAAGERAAADQLLRTLAERDDTEATGALLRLARLASGERREAEAHRYFERVLARHIDEEEAWRAFAGASPALGVGGHPPEATTPTLVAADGTPLERYRLTRELGRGSFATVYEAQDVRLGRPVALKLLFGAGLRPPTLQRALTSEAAAISRLRHPGVVAIYEVDETAGLIAMELLPGGSLRDRLRGASGHGLGTSEVGRLLRELVATISHVHAQGLVHGDISPRNVLFRRGGQAVLVDFAGEVAASDDDHAAPVGTPLYLAPERWTGADASAESDLFAVGAVCWEALVGTPPRRSEEARRAAPGSPPPIPPEVRSQRGVEPLARIIDGLLAPDPARRLEAAALALRV